MQHILGSRQHVKRGKSGLLSQSVVLIGHSMGGIVARGVMALPSYRIGSVDTIITLSSPHSTLPVYVDPSLRSQLNAINTFWRDALIRYTRSNASLVATKALLPSWAEDARARLEHVILASIAGGRRDFLVPTRAADVRSFCPPSNGSLSPPNRAAARGA